METQTTLIVGQLSTAKTHVSSQLLDDFLVFWTFHGFNATYGFEDLRMGLG